MMELENYEQAKSRLTGSIIMMGPRPVYVNEVQPAEVDGKVAKLDYLGLSNVRDIRKKGSLVFYPSPHLDLNPVPLGLVNSEDYGAVLYTTRTPARMWKTGLTSRNARAYKVVDGHPFPADHVIYSAAFAKTVVGDYPTFQEALENKAGLEGGMAFSREFSTNGDELFYKNRGRVGKLKGDAPELDEDFQFLQELLDRRLQNADG